MRSNETTPWSELSILKEIQEKNFSERTFNDRVMQSILSTEHLRKLFGRNRDAQYFQCLANLLEGNCGTSLKSHVCRIFMDMKVGSDEGQPEGGRAVENTKLIVVPSLMSLLKCENASGLFLATYATAALVNLSSGDESVKQMMMGRGMARHAIRNIKSKDDDLMYYTLMLLVNLTNAPHHCNVFCSNGLMPVLYDMLTSSYQQCKRSPQNQGGNEDGSSSVTVGNSMKMKLLTQLSIIVGQLCNEESYRQKFLEDYPHTVNCLIYIVIHCGVDTAVGCALASMAMFALKQLCANRSDQKQHIGCNVLHPLFDMLRDRDTEKSADFFSQSLLLLQMLAGDALNMEKLIDMDATSVLQGFKKLPVFRQTPHLLQKTDRLIDSMNASNVESM